MKSSLNSSLDSWLEYISSVHPREIELGLERVRRVASRLGITKPGTALITVAGTNGKGSCVASMEAILNQAGYSTGSYTSPHIHRFNERIKLSGEPVGDELLVEAFAEIDQARGDDSLSYFEFSTLAALLIFQNSSLDVALLEVGLGGRLDAVNIIDPDVAVITNISIDHEDWLGVGIEKIAAEKAGIMRPKTPVVFAAENLPESILSRAKELDARLYVLGTDFDFEASYEHNTGPESSVWQWHGLNGSDAAINLHLSVMPRLALQNVSAALQALALLPFTLEPASVNKAMLDLQLAGRFELRKDRKTTTNVVFDVAHNPAAVQLLALNLRRFRQQNPGLGRIAVVLAVMADKDIEAMVSALESCSDIWYIAQVEETRSMPAEEVTQSIKNSDNGTRVRQFENVAEAYQSACGDAATQDLIVVTGSFLTVAAVRELSTPI